jgi:hypothetical protein
MIGVETIYNKQEQLSCDKHFLVIKYTCTLLAILTEHKGRISNTKVVHNNFKNLPQFSTEWNEKAPTKTTAKKSSHYKRKRKYLHKKCII